MDDGVLIPFGEVVGEGLSLVDFGVGLGLSEPPIIPTQMYVAGQKALQSLPRAGFHKDNCSGEMENLEAMSKQILFLTTR